MRRLLSPPLALLLTTLGMTACQTSPSVTPEQISATATPVLAELLAELESTSLDRDRCMEFDAQLRSVDNHEALDAQYARAELAWSCQDPMLWQALHEELAHLGYEPSFTRLSERAIERERWQRLLTLVEDQRERGNSQVAPQRLDMLEFRAARALWHARHDKQDYELVEHLLERKLAGAKHNFPVHLEFIELYLEYVGLGPNDERFDDEPDGLLLAQLSETRARELAVRDRIESAELEFLAGFIRNLEGDREAAKTAWHEALRIDPDFVEARLWLGLAALESEDYEAARTQLHGFLKRHPNDENARYSLAIATRRAQAQRTELPSDPDPNSDSVSDPEPPKD